MDAAQLVRNGEKTRLLNRLSEIMVTELREQGIFSRVPHDSTLEQAAHELGAGTQPQFTATSGRRSCDVARAAARYLHNNHTRMDYPRYRREGLPITSSPMESLIKQINLRVKGTEMFGNEPAGAEAILQLRAASLSEDGRLEDYLRTRPGSPFVRRPRLPTAA